MQALREKAPSRTLAPWTLAVFLGACLGCGLTEPPPDSKPLVQGTEAVRDTVAPAMDDKDRKAPAEPTALPGKSSTTTLLEDGALASPDRRVSRALKSAYEEFQGAAEACLDGNALEAHFRLRDGEAALRRAASLLDPYSLRP